MSAIELAQSGLAEDITRLVAQVDNATLEDAKSAHDRMGVAREWAKLQENAGDLAERLAWLEAVILRRIGQLDAKCLPAARRAAARHFANMSDEDLAKLFTDYPARTAVAVYNLWARAENLTEARRRGAAFAQGKRESEVYVDDDESIPDALRRGIECQITSVRQAAAIIVREYAANRSVTVSSVVDEFMDEEMPNLSYHMGSLELTGFRKGLTEAVREAFSSAPVGTTERSWEIPAFITTHSVETDEWYRVPSEFARISDARNMLALRRGQLESATRSLAELERVLLDRFGVDRRDPSEFLRDDTTAMNRRMMRDYRDSEVA